MNLTSWREQAETASATPSSLQQTEQEDEEEEAANTFPMYYCECDSSIWEMLDGY